ncbi:HlyD family efflux transporter periplasmic adaptor subunit [Aureispira sp. CCB-E]|uniref:HlyD family secretion protein n=1 Tax=Aureispira sp. CCB-E TaxID=3051121 RepID=UPI0028690686|nr:HlyD family efflux transporter periplasmic adaptor subunit [Aureispira sp. CCB-E]WMX13106.1 HlyD family efflux transporter periplasmic adaptor subunit [Aureispira sp. CCB-E]
MPENTPSSEFTLVEQAMGNPPGWLTYWGITVIFIFLGVTLGITAIIRYPDVLQAEAITYIDRPPIDVFPQKNGIIQTLFVGNNDTAEYDSPLLVLESTTDWKAVLALDSLLQQKTRSIVNEDLRSKELGELNTLYQELALLDTQIKDAKRSDITTKQVTGIRNEIKQNKVLNASLLKQKEVFEKELSNVKKDLERSKQLLQDGVMSQQEFEKKENTYLQSERELHRMESSIISNRIKVQQLELQIPESDKQRHDLFFRLETEFAKKKEALKTAIEQWKTQYILHAPSSGTVVLSSNFQEGSSIKTTESVVTIMPLISQKKSFLKAKMNANGIGKIAIGQKATVYFSNYPSAEYGTLSATVSKIAPIPTENQYEILLDLPQDWVTNYGIVIPKQQKMSVTVAVQTKEYTLLERVFAGLLEVIER